MGGYVYGNFPQHVLRGDVDLDTATVKALLVTSAYVHDFDHEFLDDITGEIAGSGYTAGGITLTGITVAYDTASNMGHIDANDAAFGVVTLTDAVGLVTYVYTGTAATSPLMSFHNFPAPESRSGAPLTYQWSTEGIIILVV